MIPRFAHRFRSYFAVLRSLPFFSRLFVLYLPHIDLDVPARSNDITSQPIIKLLLLVQLECNNSTRSMAGLESVKGLCGYIGSTTSDFGGEIEGERGRRKVEMRLYGTGTSDAYKVQEMRNEEHSAR